MKAPSALEPKMVTVLDHAKARAREVASQLQNLTANQSQANARCPKLDWID